MAGAIIDDCALARQIKGGGGRIWLGLSRDVRSLRAYNTLGPFWATVSRAAFAQLNFSPLLLAATIIGMLWLYLVPPLSTLGGLAAIGMGADGAGVWLMSTGLAAWATMAGSYLPMLRWHSTSPLFAPLLPVTAMLYTLMTVDSAVRWWQGKGGEWKGRTYGKEHSGRARA